MQKNLVIVESPAKAKTIEKFLGKDYKVLSSYGHIRDLKTKQFSIDIEHNYAPQYEIPADKKKLVSELKAESKAAEMVWLASDEDREGEAISWHLYEVLGLKPENTRRIVFHEITKTAILHAIETPRSIDMNLVNAQQARRVLDRIVGFQLSPILWRKVKPALSAGRVQSVAVRLIVEREREIQDFVSEAAYRVTANFILPDGKTILKAELNRRLKTKEEAQATVDEYNKQQSDAAYLATLQAQDQANAEALAAYQLDKTKYTEEEANALIQYENQVIGEKQYAASNAIVQGDKEPGKGMNPSAAGSLVGMYWLLMLVGRLVGGSLGSKFSSRGQLTTVATIAILFLLCAMFMPDKQILIPGFENMSFTMIEAPVCVLFFILCGLCTSVMWGGIFNLAVEGLGKYTAVASGFFMVMVCGGGILPLIQGAVADVAGYLSSYWVLAAAVGYLLFYAQIGSRAKKAKA